MLIYVDGVDYVVDGYDGDDGTIVVARSMHPGASHATGNQPKHW